MTNSSLAVFTQLTTKRSAPRNKPITKVTIHHVAGNLTIESLGHLFATTTRDVSSNYGLGTDGRVGLYVEEKNRAWTSSSASNDNAAVTIEVSNIEIGGDWAISERAYASLIILLIDICKRNPGIVQKNGKPGLFFDGTPNGSLTHHQMFAATSCAGPFLLKRFQQICEEVNQRLGTASIAPAPAPQPAPAVNTGPGFKEGDVINFTGNIHYPNSQSSVGSACKPGGARITRVIPDALRPYHVIARANEGSTVYGWVNASDIGPVADIFSPYMVRVTSTSCTIRTGPGLNHGTNGSITDRGVYTIVEESGNFGKLKSGAGWIPLSETVKV